MSQTLVSLLVHVVFSTKNRAELITTDVEPDLFAYMSGILNHHESRCLSVGGTAAARCDANTQDLRGPVSAERSSRARAVVTVQVPVSGTAHA